MSRRDNRQHHYTRDGYRLSPVPDGWEVIAPASAPRDSFFRTTVRTLPEAYRAAFDHAAGPGAWQRPQGGR